MLALVTLELKQLLRGWTVATGLVLLILAGLIAVHHGRTSIERQRATLARASDLQREQHLAVLGPAPADANAGDQLYYLFFHTAHEPSDWAPIAIGLRDVQPFNVKVRLLALHGQLYDADLSNPLLAAFGNFDLSFVLVFLTPILVIAVSYDVLSSERERGTWELIRAQPSRPLHVIGLKLLTRLSVILAALVVLIMLAAVLLRLPFDERFAGVVLLTALYLAVWAGAALLVVALGRSSDFNLVALFGLWLVWSVLGPALVNVVASMRYPVPEAMELTVRQRHGYHTSWDRPVRDVMESFYRRYPEWRGAPVPEDRYSNAWYYAMQQRGDDEAEPLATAYVDTLERKSRWTARALVLSPPATFQLALNAIARTDLDSHLAYLASVAEYHERLKRHFFPIVFNTISVRSVRWADAPRHWFRDERPTTVPITQAVVLAVAALLFVSAGCLLLARQLRAGRAGLTTAIPGSKCAGDQPIAPLR
jgi:ABC-2 type transport system permease protein